MEDKECPKAFQYVNGITIELFYKFLGYLKNNFISNKLMRLYSKTILVQIPLILFSNDCLKISLVYWSLFEYLSGYF